MDGKNEIELHISLLGEILSRNARAGYMTQELATGISAVFAHEARSRQQEEADDDQHQSTAQ